MDFCPKYSRIEKSINKLQKSRGNPWTAGNKGEPFITESVKRIQKNTWTQKMVVNGPFTTYLSLLSVSLFPPDFFSLKKNRLLPPAHSSSPPAILSKKNQLKLSPSPASFLFSSPIRKASTCSPVPCSTSRVIPTTTMVVVLSTATRLMHGVF